MPDQPAITLANAPVSYGAFELTGGIDQATPVGLEVLDQVAGAGYQGIDLGPVGYLGSGAELADRLSARGLGLAGGYLELPYSDHAALRGMLAELDAMLDTLDSVQYRVPGPPPRPTLADAGSPQRRARPGQAQAEPSLGLDAEGWRRFADGLALVLRRCRDRGYEPTFHHETGTYVEAPWEIQRVLEVSDVGLCLDTGHFLIGGGDPVQALRDWGRRINHLHLKDARRDVMATVLAEGEPVESLWARQVFPPLGTGDLPVEAVLDAIRQLDYAGWLVVEQDALPRTPERFAQAAADQRANREYLRERGW